MACCLICFKGDPVPDSKYGEYYGNPNEFQTGMMKAPLKNPLWFLGGCLCSCCSQCYLRKRLLEQDMTKYICCQGYFRCPCGNCCTPGEMKEQDCPTCCLCIESFCCLSCAVAANRMYTMDKYRLVPDKWDNRIIRFNNFLQLLSCICNILAAFEPSFREAARIIDIIAEIVFYTTVGCMTAQVVTELDYQEAIAPKAAEMVRT